VFTQPGTPGGTATRLYTWRPDTQAAAPAAEVDGRGFLVKGSPDPGKTIFAEPERGQYYWMDAASGELGDCLSCSWQPPLVFFAGSSQGERNPVFFMADHILYAGPQGWMLRSWNQAEARQVLGPDA
jgi:hypothetical protein